MLIALGAEVLSTHGEECEKSAQRQSLHQRAGNMQRGYQYLGMDLDNTLHDFRGASKAAMEKVYAYLNDKTEVSIDELKRTYKALLKDEEARGFVENISRTEYRRRRFAKLLDGSKISLQYIDDLLKIFDHSFVENIHGYDQMMEFLEKSHEELGLKIIIISEGPEDAQEITLSKLGIKNLVERLFTASVEGTSKTENLFPIVLERLKCEPQEIFYIGDSKARDIVPAMKAGIRAALFNPKKQFAPQIEKFSWALNQPSH